MALLQLLQGPTIVKPEGMEDVSNIEGRLVYEGIIG